MYSKKFEALKKTAWSPSDIADFAECSIMYANQIKKKTEEKYGCILVDKGKGKTLVSADAVIKALGGVDRLTEIKILSSILSIKIPADSEFYY